MQDSPLLPMDAERARWQAKSAAASKNVVEGVRDSDIERFADGITYVLECCSSWSQARTLRRAAKHQGASAEFRRRVRRLWVGWGMDIRGSVQDDIALVEFMRAVLPPYRGPQMRLYRGESWRNRKCRSYGLSWTRHLSVAQSFAERNRAACDGGTVVLVTEPPPGAIICAIPRDADRFGEAEYVVDRRLLARVEVAERFP